MQESVKRYAEGVRREQGAVIRIRVGLNSGAVVVRAIGSDLHMDYSAIGQTTHLAARMEQLADAGAVVITPDTLALAESYIEVKSLGPVPVKGLAEPVEVYEVTGVGQARTRLQAAVRRGLTRFVGRDAEVEHLRRVLGQADAGHGQVVAIVGEAGVGKSRLTYEFTHSPSGAGLADPGGLVRLLRQGHQLPARDRPAQGLLQDRRPGRPPGDARQGAGAGAGLDRALDPLLPPLLALLDVPVEDPAWQNSTPAAPPAHARRDQASAAAREPGQPLLVVFEDLHWIDGETQALLDSLVESLGSGACCSW
jgi:hypothetical protein